MSRKHKFKRPTNLIFKNQEKNPYDLKQKIFLHLLYAFIFPILNLFFNFRLSYDLKGKPRFVLRTLFYSSVIVYGIWNLGCIYLILLLVSDILMDRVVGNMFISTLFLSFFIWLLIKYNSIIYERHMKQLLHKKL